MSTATKSMARVLETIISMGCLRSVISYLADSDYQSMENSIHFETNVYALLETLVVIQYVLTTRRGIVGSTQSGSQRMNDNSVRRWCQRSFEPVYGGAQRITLSIFPSAPALTKRRSIRSVEWSAPRSRICLQTRSETALFLSLTRPRFKVHWSERISGCLIFQRRILRL